MTRTKWPEMALYARPVSARAKLRVNKIFLRKWLISADKIFFYIDKSLGDLQFFYTKMNKIGSLILKKRVGSYFLLEIKFKYHFSSKTLPDFVYFNFIGFLSIRTIFNTKKSSLWGLLKKVDRAKRSSARRSEVQFLKVFRAEIFLYWKFFGLREIR